MNPTDEETNVSPPPAGVPLAKLSLPRLAQGVSRPRLFAALDEARSRRAVWIAAPAGAGKTTLAATYLLERKLAYVWYQLDQDDADPATFFYYLGLAARQAVSDPDFHPPLLTPEYLPDLLGFARRYFRTLFGRLPAGTILVLDNYQDLGEAPLLAEILRNGIAEIPLHGNVLVLSRDEPPPMLIESSDPDGLSLLDWDRLRLNYEETRAIVVQSRTLDDAALQALYRRADGWPAGVTLLLEQVTHSAPDATVLEGTSPAAVFQFFACEFFNQLPQSTQDFLLKTALLSHVTPALAEGISGNPDAEGILGDLHRRRFFIHRRDLEQSSYQYHALFREFLLATLPERYSPDAYIALIRQVAGMLTKAGRQEEAVSLLLRAEDWQRAAPLLLEAAPVLFAQGRAQTIAAWLRQIPDEFVQAVPWLLYWRGMSHAFADPEFARCNLEQAYHRFFDVNDALGQMLAAAGIMDIIFFLRESLLKAAPWADTLQGLLSERPVLPPALEAQLLSSLLAIVELLRPNDPLLPRYAERLLEFLDADIDDNQKALIAPRLIIYHAVISGDAAACDAVLIAGNLIMARPHVSEGTRIHWKLLSVLPAIHLGQKGQATNALHTLIEFIGDGNLERNLRKQNLLRLRFLASWYASLVYLAQENYPAVNALLESMARAVDETESIDMAIYAMVKTMHALGQGDLATAKQYGEISLFAHNSVGAMITGLDVYCLLALERCASGEFEAALELLVTPKRYGTATTPCLNYQVYLSEAFVYLSAGDATSCRSSLGEAFSIARRNRFLGFWFWLTRAMPALLSEALRAGIEPDFVREVIRTQNVAPAEGAPDDWPWSVRLHALGGLRVEVDGRELPQSQMQGKPLALLTLLIATGSKEIRIEQLSEQLWPHSEGDAALSAFSTTASRLRKLIGDEGVVVQAGRVSLNERQYWLDVRALERRLDYSQRRERAEAALEEEVEAILTLYRGPFLPREQATWAADMRKRLRGRMVHWSARIAAELRSAGHEDAAASLFDRLAAVDPALAAE